MPAVEASGTLIPRTARERTPPLLVVGVVARLVHRLDYVRLCGLVAGSMTAPPALAFGNALLGGDAASTIYAAVYPLTMLLRVVTAQILALAIVGGGQSLSRPA